MKKTTLTPLIAALVCLLNSCDGGKSKDNKEWWENADPVACLCGGCLQLHSANTTVDFRLDVVAKFSKPEKVSKNWRFSMGIGGELLKPKVLEGPCAGIERNKGRQLVEFKLNSGDLEGDQNGLHYIINKNAQGQMDQVHVIGTAKVPSIVHDGLTNLGVFSSLNREESSAETDHPSLRQEAWGSLPVTPLDSVDIMGELLVKFHESAGNQGKM